MGNGFVLVFSLFNPALSQSCLRKTPHAFPLSWSAGPSGWDCPRSCPSETGRAPFRHTFCSTPTWSSDPGHLRAQGCGWGRGDRAQQCCSVAWMGVSVEGAVVSREEGPHCPHHLAPGPLCVFHLPSPCPLPEMQISACMIDN